MYAAGLHRAGRPAHGLPSATLARGAARRPTTTWRPVADGARPGGDVYQLTVRRGDVDEHGLVRDVAFFEFLQEARIKFLMGLHTRGQHWSHHVVARTDVDFLEPLPHRREPYAVRSWIGHVGTRSFTIQAEVLDGDRVLARAAVVMVIFDMETQRPDRHGRHAARAAAPGARLSPAECVRPRGPGRRGCSP